MSEISLKMFAIVFAWLNFGIFAIGGSNPVFGSNQEIPCCRLATGSCRNVCSQISIVELGAEAKVRETATQHLRQFCSIELTDFWACMNYTLNVRKAALREVIQYIHGNIGVGVGYSADSQQVAPQRCYNVTVSSIGEQQAYIQLANTISFSELEKVLGVSVSVRGRFEMFAAEANAIYMRSLQDNDYTMSLNYYEYATSNVAVQIAGLGVEGLTESGKSFYNDGKNPYFGLLCGDYFIGSFEQGALLTMGIIVKFRNSIAKDEFYQKAGAKFGNIVRAVERIESVSAKYKMAGSITIQAFQIGGEPSQLAKILNKDSTGNYYALSCSLIAMYNCTQAASYLLHYATDEFVKQFSFKTNTGIKPLGTGYSKYYPIEWINLISPVSLVTQIVARYRIKLSKRLRKNVYYQQKLYPFLNNGYPTKLDDAFIDNAKAILSKANRNVHTMMQPHGGAVDCFNMPDQCTTIKARIYSQLQKITMSELIFLKDIKYTMRAPYAMLYNTGSERAESWDSVSDDENTSVKLLSVYVTDKQCSYCILIHRSKPNYRLFEQCFNGNATSNGMGYIGNICQQLPEIAGVESFCWKFELSKLPSPFFFEAYKNRSKARPIIDFNPFIHSV